MISMVPTIYDAHIFRVVFSIQEASNAGNAPDLSTRWGDYFYAATQPGATSTFWISGDYRTIILFQGWQTRIGKITFS